jgi:hypothetical protein
MSDMSTIFENLVCNVFFRGSSHTGGQLWVGLYTVAPGEGGGGTEASGGWYGRQSPGATPSTAWVAPSDGLISNGSQLTWNAVTGSGVPVVSVAISTALSGGDMWMYKGVTTVTYNVGDIPIILASGLQVQFQ